MIFLADIETDGYHNKKNKKKINNKPRKQKKSGFIRLVNKTAGVARFTKGELAVVKSMVSNDVKTPINTQKKKQKTIGAKKRTTHHRSM